MRMTCAALINLFSLPYIEMARLKGASQGRVVMVHALRNALAPIVNVVVLNLAYLVTGVVIVEVVFVYPGFGRLLVDSVSKRDVPVVQAICPIISITYIVLNLFADIVSIVSNPSTSPPRSRCCWRSARRSSRSARRPSMSATTLPWWRRWRTE